MPGTAKADHDRDNLRNAREFLRTPECRPPFELDWARRVLERLTALRKTPYAPTQ